MPWANQASFTQVQKPWLKQSQPQYSAGKGSGAWGAGDGWGKGGGWSAPAKGKGKGKAPPSLPAGFEVDPTVRYTGTVSFYHKWKGYGFIELAEKGVVPQDRIFCHWRNIQSDDRFPFLVKDLEVEFSMVKYQDKLRWNIQTVRADSVSLVGGTAIAMQDDVDAQEKQFVGGQHLRYTGNLKFFNPRIGFGYVTMDEGYDVEPGVPTEMRVETTEVNAGGKRPLPMQNLAVEFGIWKTARGGYKVYNMTLPGGHPLTQDALENRITMGTQAYTGKIAIWNWRNGWGFIRADQHVMLPPRVTTKLQQQQQAAAARGRKVSLDDKMFYFRRADCLAGTQARKDMEVSYQLYIDDKGVGACEVVNLSGW